ncbi:hypothetical protein EBR57_10750 [bacterium]|nr:hypothetical protein [bacterium]
MNFGTNGDSVGPVPMGWTHEIERINGEYILKINERVHKWLSQNPGHFTRGLVVILWEEVNHIWDTESYKNHGVDPYKIPK